MFISKTYPIKGAPIYRAYEVKDEIVTQVAHNANVVALVAELEAAEPKPVIYFDDDTRLDFWRSLD